ncbi:hypothetical protein [Anaeromyxobacter sp. SG17]|uniref:hypothetical protein n=1 Tax=Anaeromyxobacter sp. SG17 TaxID=2925405 RepID=UPI001F57D395|nr:hypothetical protein [Anaeromyxobacter sp. SG17]
MSRAARAGSLLAVGALALAACEQVPSQAVTRCESTQVVPAAVKTDILFVIDDSISMDEEQTNLRDNLNAFITALVAAPVANEFQIGITSTSVEDYGATATSGQAYTSGPATGKPFPDGALIAIQQSSPGVAVPGDILWKSGTGFEGTRILTASSPSLVDDFKANVRVGTYGTFKEQPFRAARLALSDRIADGTNAGFLRSGARLAVVFVSDEDDCSDTAAPFAVDDVDCHNPGFKASSLDSIGDVVTFLRDPIDGERREVVVASIVGVDPASGEPSCATCANDVCGTALDGGLRFTELASALGSVRTRTGSICDASFKSILEDIAGLLVAQSVPLQGTPADWRMLAVGVDRAGLETIPCTVALDGTAEAATAGAVYTPPLSGRPATVTFQNACRLQQGDRVQLQLICAG